MPAKKLLRVVDEGVYSHIYNSGIENRIIFADDEDRETFLKFLAEYLSAPKSTKKSFSVKGKTFNGIPHQPKNYFNKVELVASDLTPHSFHLILHQITKNSIEGLVRSLCTRYSIYFNKKYDRRGSLFEGPYKSIHIKTTNEVQALKQEFSERKIQKPEVQTPVHPHSRLPELAFLTTAFFVLVTFGAHNIQISTEAKIAAATPVPAVAAVQDEAPPETPKIQGRITIPDGSTKINVRQGPSTRYEKVAEAINGDTYEIVSQQPKWYEIRLTDNTTGFVSDTYIQILETIN